MLPFSWWTNKFGNSGAIRQPDRRKLHGGRVALTDACSSCLNWMDCTSGCLQLYHTTWHNLFVSLPPTPSLSTLFIPGLNLQLWHRFYCANVGRVSLHCLLRSVLQKCGCCPDVCSCLILYFCLDLLISFLPLLFCLFYFLSQESCCFFSLWSLSFSCRASLSALSKASTRLQIGYPAGNCSYPSHQRTIVAI